MVAHRLVQTPLMKTRIIIPPIGGWKERTWYVVEVSFNPHNPTFGALFFTGFLNGPNGGPGGYNEIAGLEDKTDIGSVHYLRALRELTNQGELDDVPQSGVTSSTEMLSTMPLDCTTRLELRLR